MDSDFTVTAGSTPGMVRHDGRELAPPHGWVLVPSGDPGLTRRLKGAGAYWKMVHMQRNRLEAVGLWVDAEVAAAIRAELAAERAEPGYQKKLDSARRSREVKQAAYVDEFRNAVLEFLNFAPNYAALAAKLADAVTAPTVPVGSGTVARTTRIPVARRAEAAVIAWLRHQTTAYDRMTIARIKGERREVRRQLAARSRELLSRYRAGLPVDQDVCPLARALR